LRDGSPETEEAGVNGLKSFLGSGVIEKIFVDVSAELGIGVHQRATGDDADFVNDGGSEAGFEDGVADRAGCAKEENLHEGKSLHESARLPCEMRNRNRSQGSKPPGSVEN